MDVYKLYADANRFQNFHIPSDEDGFRLLDQFDGTPLADSWTPLAVEVLDGHEDWPTSDFPSLGRIPVFGAHAVAELSDLVDGRGELLPLDFDQGEYFAFNVTRLSDALDEERSEFKYFSDGDVMDIKSYEFAPERLAAETIFKLPQIPEMYEFVTDVFVERVHERELTGFLFNQKVWSGKPTRS